MYFFEFGCYEFSTDQEAAQVEDQCIFLDLRKCHFFFSNHSPIILNLIQATEQISFSVFDHFSKHAFVLNDSQLILCTGKSLSEVLIFASTKPQYDDILFIELQVQYMNIPSSNLGRTCYMQKLFLIFRTIFVHNMFSPCSAKRRASD